MEHMNEEAKAFYKTLGAEIRRCREFNNLTLEQVAKEMNLSPQTIKEFESGQRKITAFTLNMILKIVDADPISKN